MGMNPDDPRVRFGAKWEMLGKNMLKRMGWYVLPFSILSDGPAPVLEAHLRNNLISPDALVAKDGCLKWVDFKAKAEWTVYKKGGYREQTGISERHYRNYLEVEKTTGFECWLAFFHLGDPFMLMQSLSQLTPDHFDPTGGRMNYPTVYFNMCDFIQVPIPESGLTQALVVAARESLLRSHMERINAGDHRRGKDLPVIRTGFPKFDSLPSQADLDRARDANRGLK